MEALRQFADALCSGQAPEQFRIAMDYCGLGDKGANIIAEMLKMCKAPINYL